MGVRRDIQAIISGIWRFHSFYNSKFPHFTLSLSPPRSPTQQTNKQKLETFKSNKTFETNFFTPLLKSRKRKIVYKNKAMRLSILTLNNSNFFFHSSFPFHRSIHNFPFFSSIQSFHSFLKTPRYLNPKQKKIILPPLNLPSFSVTELHSFSSLQHSFKVPNFWFIKGIIP